MMRDMYKKAIRDARFILARKGVYEDNLLYAEVISGVGLFIAEKGTNPGLGDICTMMYSAYNRTERAPKRRKNASKLSYHMELFRPLGPEQIYLRKERLNEAVNYFKDEIEHEKVLKQAHVLRTTTKMSWYEIWLDVPNKYCEQRSLRRAYERWRAGTDTRLPQLATARLLARGYDVPISFAMACTSQRVRGSRMRMPKDELDKCMSNVQRYRAEHPGASWLEIWTHVPNMYRTHKILATQFCKWKKEASS